MQKTNIEMAKLADKKEPAKKAAAKKAPAKEAEQESEVEMDSDFEDSNVENGAEESAEQPQAETPKSKAKPKAKGPAKGGVTKAKNTSECTVLLTQFHRNRFFRCFSSIFFVVVPKLNQTNFHSLSPFIPFQPRSQRQKQQVSIPFLLKMYS